MSQNNDQNEEFKPRGTLAVLGIFVITLIALWATVYLIMLSQGVTL